MLSNMLISLGSRGSGLCEIEVNINLIVLLEEIIETS